MYYEYLANGCSRALAYYNTGYRFFIDENISHNKVYRYSKALEYVTKAYENGLEYAKEFKEKIEELLEIAKLQSKAKIDKLHLGKRKDVFISWNHNDVDIKDDLYKFIEKNNYFTCWESDRDCNGSINKVCREAILDSSLFIVIITKNSLNSRYVKEEIETMLNRIEENLELEKCIKPVFIDRYVKRNGKIKKVNVCKIIDKMARKHSKNPFVIIKNKYGSSFNKLDHDKILEFIMEGLQTPKIKKYKEKLIEDTNVFESALKNTIPVEPQCVWSGAFSTTLKMEDAYISQPVFKDIDDGTQIEESMEEILNSKDPILLYGEGGIGKSLFIKNLIHQKFIDTNFFFYLTTKEIVSYNASFFKEALSLKFESYFSERIKSLSCVETILSHGKDKHNVYIVVDALDEISSKDKQLVLKNISIFQKQYDFVHFIFSSRNSEDAHLISSEFSRKISSYMLKGMSKENIGTIFDNILKKTEFHKNKNHFLKALDTLDESVCRNPMIISNLIILYFLSGTIPKKLYDILSNMINLVFDTQEMDKDASIKYPEMLNAEYRKILEYIAFHRANASKKTSLELLKDFYSYTSSFKEELVNKFDIANNVFEHLKSRHILVNETFNHQIYNDYFTSSYCYNHIYQINPKDTFNLKYINNKLNISELLNYSESFGEHWINIIIYLFLSLDYEIYRLGPSGKENLKLLLDLFETLWKMKEEYQKELDRILKNDQLFHSVKIREEFKI